MRGITRACKLPNFTVGGVRIQYNASFALLCILLWKVSGLKLGGGGLKRPSFLKHEHFYRQLRNLQQFPILLRKIPLGTRSNYWPL
jgi:hypothetical protein